VLEEEIRSLWKLGLVLEVISPPMQQPLPMETQSLRKLVLEVISPLTVLTQSLQMLRLVEIQNLQTLRLVEILRRLPAVVISLWKLVQTRSPPNQPVATQTPSKLVLEVISPLAVPTQSLQTLQLVETQSLPMQLLVLMPLSRANTRVMVLARQHLGVMIRKRWLVDHLRHRYRHCHLLLLHRRRLLLLMQAHRAVAGLAVALLEVLELAVVVHARMARCNVKGQDSRRVCGVNG